MLVSHSLLTSVGNSDKYNYCSINLWTVGLYLKTEILILNTCNFENLNTISMMWITSTWACHVQMGLSLAVIGSNLDNRTAWIIQIQVEWRPLGHLRKSPRFIYQNIARGIDVMSRFVWIASPSVWNARWPGYRHGMGKIFVKKINWWKLFV